MTSLPNKPSALIRLALDDLAKCEADPRYVVYMGVWHYPGYNRRGACSVCLAGAVMAQHCEVPFDKETWPHGEDKAKFQALNSFRCGNVSRGLDHLNLDVTMNLDRGITSYCDDPEQFHAEMHQLANDLASVGL